MDLDEEILTQFDGLYDVAYFHDAKMADIDSDGDLDLFVSASLYSTETPDYTDYNLFQFENTGSPRSPDFHLVPRSVLADFDARGMRFHFVDIDSDGDLDVVAVTWLPDGGVTTSYLNVGTPGQAEFIQYTIPGLETEYAHYQFSFADVNGDGYVDAMLSGELYGAFLLKHNGSQSSPEFHPAPVTWSDLSQDGKVLSDEVNRGRFFDVDGDGDMDLLYQDWPQTDLFFGPGGWMPNTGSVDEPHFDLSQAQMLMPYNRAVPVVNSQDVDINNDGKSDFLNVVNGAYVTVQKNLGSADNPYYLAMSEWLYSFSNHIDIDLDAEAVSRGRTEVVSRISSQGQFSDTDFSVEILTREGKITTRRGPVTVSVPNWTSKVRYYQERVRGEKSFSVLVKYSDQKMLACQTLVLK